MKNFYNEYAITALRNSDGDIYTVSDDIYNDYETAIDNLISLEIELSTAGFHDFGIVKRLVTDWEYIDR